MRGSAICYEDLWHISNLGFLRLAGPFAQAAPGHHVPVHFHDSIVEAVRRSRPLARECDVTFVATLAQSSNSDAAVEVLGYPPLLEAMVESVLRNALHASPPGSRVELDVQVCGNSIVLRVRDHRTGVAVECLESASGWFDVPPPQEHRSSGSGFDLAIAKRLAEHHRGAISLRDCAGGGCELAIRLPRWQAADPQPL